MKSLVFIVLAAVAQAVQVSFRVFAPGATQVSVSVNGQLTQMTAADPNIPYFTASAEAATDAKYKYVAGGETEAFDRSIPSGRTSTYNDFFNRPITYADIPELPWPIENNPQWTRSGPKQPIFDTNYIVTIWVQGDKGSLDGIIAVPAKTKIPTTVTFVLADEVKTFQNVSFSVNGVGKKNNNAKQSWNMRLSPGDIYQNRNFYKFRHMEEDPTQIREKLWADISRAMGTYANEANMVRLFINGDGMGTFNLVDDITDYSYPMAMFYAGKPPAQMGALFDGSSGASFQASSAGYSAWIPNKRSPEPPNAIGPFCELWSKTDYKNDAAIAEADKQLNLDMFMRFMVLEYLTGHWDGYWEAQTNIGLYRDPTENNRWYYLGQDYDATFGVNIPEGGTTFATWSYKQFPAAFPNAVLINGLLQNPNQQRIFEQYLTNTVKVLFNNVTLTNRILKYHEFILPDLAWDRNITQRSPGINFNWNFQQVTQNLWEGVSSPTNTGGGADIGLIEWIIIKSQSVAKEFSITITDTPVGPPATKPAGGSGTGGSGSTPTPGTSTPGGSNSAAGYNVPQTLVTLALAGASLVALLAQ